MSSNNSGSSRTQLIPAKVLATSPLDTSTTTSNSVSDTTQESSGNGDLVNGMNVSVGGSGPAHQPNKNALNDR